MSFRFIAQRIFSKQLYKSAYSRAIFTSMGISLQETKVCFSQFFTLRYPLSFFYALHHCITSWMRWTAGRSARMSYAHTGEDRLIDSILKPIITKKGFYVEVGCNEPIFISNTFSLYKRGWRGICIDANETLTRKYGRLRPRDVAITALVSNEKTTRDYFIYTNNVLSSTEHMNIDIKDEPGFEVSQVKKMQPESLTEILDRCKAPARFDLLSVDAEEHDLQVLQSLDFSKYSPKLIVVESESFDPSKPDNDLIYQLVMSKGYRFEGSVLKNLYFLRK
ncbi:MAG: FkbM family methyltransferase [Cytophagaceae bacterium]|nr:FkbM family methyltransferase [Cytophagaceae bacterium]